MPSLAAASSIGFSVYLLVLLSGVAAEPNVIGLSYDDIDLDKYKKYNKYDQRGKNGKYSGKEYKRKKYQGHGGFEDEAIIAESINVSPYLGPHVPGQEERDELTVRDQHQQLTVALIVLGVLLGVSCIPMCLILWCCIITGRRVRKLKLEELQREFDFD